MILLYIYNNNNESIIKHSLLLFCITLIIIISRKYYLYCSKMDKEVEIKEDQQNMQKEQLGRTLLMLVNDTLI